MVWPTSQFHIFRQPVVPLKEGAFHGNQYTAESLTSNRYTITFTIITICIIVLLPFVVLLGFLHSRLLKI